MKINMELSESKKQTIRTICYFIAVFASLFTGYIIGRQVEKDVNKPKPFNPYTKIHTLNDISIAVNESNDLLMIEKKTGNYIIYSDSVGNCIFKMYVNRIYNQHNNNEVK
jgi:hypothetical protein